MNAESHSASPLLFAQLYGPLVRGRVLGRQHLQFGDYIVSLTPPGSPRMPNGIACAVQARSDNQVVIGDGRLLIGEAVIWPGPEWNPVPTFAAAPVMPAGPEPPVSALAGLGPGLTPAGDDLLAGYIAGLVLLNGQRKKATRLAEDAAARTGSLSATLLRHAALGEVPEAVHWLLTTGDARPLLSFGHSSGPAWLRGLLWAGYLFDVSSMPNPAIRVMEAVH